MVLCEYATAPHCMCRWLWTWHSGRIESVVQDGTGRVRAYPIGMVFALIYVVYVVTSASPTKGVSSGAIEVVSAHKHEQHGM